MKKSVLLALVIVLFSGNVFSETLNVGCVTKCDFFFRFALSWVGKRTGHKVILSDISASGSEVDWKKYDAVIIPGGADINPQYYMSAIEPDLQQYTQSLDHLVKYSAEGKRRDPIEYGFLQQYFKREDTKDLPLLGVCRGMQMLAVSQGIPLYVDIKTELGIKNRHYLYDRIYMEDGDTLMNELFIAPFKAFERHHQGIRVPYYLKNASRWPHLKVTSFSNNGTIAESIEFENRPVLGVQFHPENDFGFERNEIFGWLLNKAAERKQSKLQ